jgi:hypothetical protein
MFGAPLEPVIESILDVDNDQGRRVRIQFSRSRADDAGVSPSVVHSWADMRWVARSVVRLVYVDEKLVGREGFEPS